MPDRVEAALSLHALGWQVVPASRRGKLPIGEWKRWQTERVPERAVREGFAAGEPNAFVITGAASRLCVLDCDTLEADIWWREKLGGDVLDATTQVITRQGRHYYFRLAEGQVERGRSRHEAGIDWDLRAEGGGVIAPPSIHETGHRYEWAPERGPEALQDAPTGLFERTPGEPSDAPRSLLNQLLENPPAEGGRNNWLARVAGHYALHIPHRDAFETMVRQAADALTPALPEHEIAKLVGSIWQAERAKEGKAPEPVSEDDEEDAWRKNLQEATAETGWLVSGGTRILVQVAHKEEDEDGESKRVAGLEMWMDGDLRVLGIVEYGGNRTYEVEVRKPGGYVATDSLPADAVANAQRLPAWLSRHGIAIGGPDSMWPARMRESARLLRYLEAQEAPALEAIPYLGWHDESSSFVTHEGVIRLDGPVGFERVRPVPAMKNWAKYRYGTEAGSDIARGVLSRVLEFHDGQVASVFAAWWMASLLRPQIQRLVSQFPFMALEAASESGKTTGYFNLMMELSGHYGGQSNPTTAALRDALSANRSGIVWVDDLDDLHNHGELLRNVTVGGSMVKKGEDNHTQVTATMRASLVVSGEGLGLHGQKALLDRAILLNVPSPVGRLSRSGRAQWEDILDLHREYPDLTALAGSIVQLALQHEGEIRDLKSLREGSGRFADKIAIIRLGARILAKVVQEQWMVDLADDWCDAQKDSGAENALTLTIIPEVLAITGFKRKPEGPDEGRRLVPTPVFVDRRGEDPPIIWFSPMLLEAWLQRNRRKGAGTRLETKQSLEDQARALDLGGARGVDRKQFKYTSGDGRAMYWRCPAELTQELLSRAEGFEGGEPYGEDSSDLLFGD